MHLKNSPWGKSPRASEKYSVLKIRNEMWGNTNLLTVSTQNRRGSVQTPPALQRAKLISLKAQLRNWDTQTWAAKPLSFAKLLWPFRHFSKNALCRHKAEPRLHTVLIIFFRSQHQKHHCYLLQNDVVCKRWQGVHRDHCKCRRHLRNSREEQQDF